MHTPRFLLSFGLLAGISCPLLGAEESAPSSRVEVNFHEPAEFTDLKDRDFGGREVNEAFLRQLKEHLERSAARRLAPGQRLVVTIEDVDMAGDFEPWRSVHLQDVRIVKDIYPPRINLKFKLLNASGRVVAEGERELRDLAFSMRSSMLSRTDPLRYEKALLDDWLRREFRSAKKKR